MLCHNISNTFQIKKNIELLFAVAKQMGEKPVIENETAQSIDKGIKQLKDIVSGKVKPKRLQEVLNAI